MNVRSEAAAGASSAMAQADPTGPVGIPQQPIPRPQEDVVTGQTAQEAVDPETRRRRWDLVLQHRDELLAIARRRVASREDAEDVVATAMIRTVEYRGRLDERRVGAFLCTTVLRLAVDVHRDRARQLALGVRQVTRDLSATPFEETICDEAEARWLAASLATCPPRERQVLDARVRGLSPQQTTAELGLSAKATENAYTRVRHRAHALVAATLAGLGILVNLGQRLTRPSFAVLPAAIAAATFVFAQTQPQDAATPTRPTQVTEMPSTSDENVRGVGGSSGKEPEATAGRAPVAAESRATSPQPGASSANRTELAPPPLVDKAVLDPGVVYIEDRHEDENFEESLNRCISGTSKITPEDPLADPCA